MNSRSDASASVLPLAAAGQRIRELRERQKYSRETLAARASINVANLARIERGKVNPNLNTLVRIADGLGTSVADLVRDIPTHPTTR